MNKINYFVIIPSGMSKIIRHATKEEQVNLIVGNKLGLPVGTIIINDNTGKTVLDITNELKEILIKLIKKNI